MDYRGRGFHTSRMRTAKVNQEEEADTRILVKEYLKYGRKGTWALEEGKIPNKA